MSPTGYDYKEIVLRQDGGSRFNSVVNENELVKNTQGTFVSVEIGNDVKENVFKCNEKMYSVKSTRGWDAQLQKYNLGKTMKYSDEIIRRYLNSETDLLNKQWIVFATDSPVLKLTHASGMMVYLSTKIGNMEGIEFHKTIELKDDDESDSESHHLYVHKCKALELDINQFIELKKKRMVIVSFE